MNRLLLSYTDQFYRRAGLLKVPEQLLNDVFRYVTARYCRLVLPTVQSRIDQWRSEGEGDKSLQHLRVLHAHCARLADSDPEGHDPEKYFALSPEIFPYKIEFPEAIEFEFTAQFVTAKRKPLINAEGDWAGLYQSRGAFPSINQYKKKHILDIGTVYVARNPAEAARWHGVPDLNASLTDLKRTTRHELQHFIQNVLEWLTRKQSRLEGKDLFRNEEWRGLPSAKIRERDRDMHGRSVSEIGKPDVDKLPHALRDVEFYTRLSDSVERFNEVKTLLPLKLHPLLAKAWIREVPASDIIDQLIAILRTNKRKEFEQGGIKNYLSDAWSGLSNLYRNMILGNLINEQSPQINPIVKGLDDDNFFQILKDRAPGKWQKAVKEFYKAVKL